MLKNVMVLKTLCVNTVILNASGKLGSISTCVKSTVKQPSRVLNVRSVVFNLLAEETSKDM